MATPYAGSGPSTSVPRQTQTAGTAIIDILENFGPYGRVKLTSLRYTCGATAHTVTILKELARCKVFSAVLAAGVSLVLDKDPGLYSVNFPATRPAVVADNAIAANDFIAYKMSSGRWKYAKITAAVTDPTTGRVTVTIPAAPTGGIAPNTPVIFFGAPTDSSPLSGRAHTTYLMTVSVLNTLGVNGEVLDQADIVNSPLLVNVDNITAAGVLEGASGYIAP